MFSMSEYLSILYSLNQWSFGEQSWQIRVYLLDLVQYKIFGLLFEGQSPNEV